MKILNYTFWILLVFLTSCNQRVLMEEHEMSLEKAKFNITVPMGYKILIIRNEHEEVEKQFRYKKSVNLYVTSYVLSPLNSKNVEKLGDSIFKTRQDDVKFKSQLSKEFGKTYYPETLVLQGRSRMGLYWKDIREGFLSRGYVNVPKRYKKYYDQALSSFKER